MNNIISNCKKGLHHEPNLESKKSLSNNLKSQESGSVLVAVLGKTGDFNTSSFTAAERVSVEFVWYTLLSYLGELLVSMEMDATSPSTLRITKF